ncbi:hypothetical protein TKK_0000450 [Trichogramma kaykai]
MTNDYVMCLSCDGVPGTIVVRVGNNRPDLGTNPVCNRFTGPLEEGSPLFLPCNPPMPGAFVSVHLESTKPKQPVQLSLCEAFVYTDQALPIERCPQFRDQPPGSTATYNGKCYIFYNRQPRNFRDALDFCRDRGGSLVDESNPALQGFISWELWRRHRSDTSSQYWMGAVRDPKDRSVWRWTGSGDEISVSFWSIPQGTEQDCARYDGSRGWLWSDTPCNARLNYICQHQPRACGRPEQPPNSTMSVVGPNAGNKSLLDSSRRYQVGTNVEYSCDTGSLLIGPSTRTCLDTGFYNEFPPVCKSIECGYPANIKHGGYTLINDTVTYLSQVLYSCEEGFEMTGRARLTCDIDERWNGPPPRCEPIRCDAPAVVPHASLAIEEIDIEDIGSAGKSSSAALLSQGQAAKSLFVGSIVTYTCEKGYKLIGNRQLLCLTSGSYDRAAPTCIEDSQREQSPTPSSPATTKPSSSKPSATRGRPFLPTRTRSTTTTQAPTSPSGSTSRSTTSTMTTTTTTTNQPPIQRVYHTTTRTRPQLPTTPSLVGSELPASVKETEQKRPSIGLQRPVETKRPPVHETADHPQDNEISGSGVDNAHAEIGAGVPEPNGPYRINRADQPTSHQAKLNMTMIIGVAIFGAVVFLAVIITTTILVMKNSNPYGRGSRFRGGRNAFNVVGGVCRGGGGGGSFASVGGGASGGVLNSNSAAAAAAAMAASRHCANDGGEAVPSRWYTLLALPFPDQHLGRRDLTSARRPNDHPYSFGLTAAQRAGYFSNPSL